MELMRQLIGILTEAEERTFDIEELVKTFKTPAEIEKHAKKLWGTGKLTYKGQQFFSPGSHNLGPVYKAGMAAAEKELKKGISLEVEFEGETEMDDYAKPDEVKEVYLGYSIQEDCLYMGFDVWMNDEDVEKLFDKVFEAARGEEFDPDQMKGPHADAWKKFKNEDHGFIGALVKLETKDGKKFTADADLMDTGGFYGKRMYKSRMFKNLNLIDLRLS